MRAAGYYLAIPTRVIRMLHWWISRCWPGHNNTKTHTHNTTQCNASSTFKVCFYYRRTKKYNINENIIWKVLFTQWENISVNWSVTSLFKITSHCFLSQDTIQKKIKIASAHRLLLFLLLSWWAAQQDMPLWGSRWT